MPERPEAPIGEAIERLAESRDVVLGLPAHGFARGAVVPDGARWLGESAYRADVGLEKGLDDRHHSLHVAERAEALFAAAVGADACHFSTNGSSLGVRVALLAVARPGDTVVVARNSHLAVFSGLVVSGAAPVYVDPVYDEELELAHGVDPDALDAVLGEHPEARAVVVASPTYYGVASDVAGLARVAHSHDVALVVDEAWGLANAFCSRLPEPAIAMGADLTVSSLHKALSGLAQTAVVCRRGERVDPDRLRVALELERSTSVSSVLLCSADAARLQFERDGERLLGTALDRAAALRGEIAAIDGLAVFGEDDLPSLGVAALDPAHVTIDVSGLGVTGFAAADWLAEQHGVIVGLCDRRRIMTLVLHGDPDGADAWLLEALRRLAERPPRSAGAIPASPPLGRLRTESVLTPREAMLGSTASVPVADAIGRVAAEMVSPYPPGVPLLVPGERITAPIADFLREVAAAGGALEGAGDTALDAVRVVA